MSPSKREREYARRRYIKWQTKRHERSEQRAVNRRDTTLAVVAIIAVVIAAWWFSTRPTDSVTTADSGPAPAAGADPAQQAQPGADTESGGPGDGGSGDPSKTWPTPPPKTLAEGSTWTWKVTTNKGPVTIALNGAKAPQAVSSTVFLTQNKFYDNTPCHRLTVEGLFVLQCGDPQGTGTGGPGYQYGPLENVPSNQKYPAGTVAMARSGGDENSMTSQFFIVYKDTELPGGYSVIGKVTSGLDVVTKIAQKGVTEAPGSLGPGDGAPAEPVTITTATVAKQS